MKQYFLLAIGLFLGFSVLQAQKPTVLPGYQPDAFYLKFKAGTLNLPKGDSRHVPVSALFPTATKGKLQKYGLRAEAFCLRLNNNPALQYAFKLRFDSVQNADLLLRQLQQDPRVELVERVPLYRAAACPSDGFPRKNNPKDTPNDSFYGIVDNIHASWYLDKMGFAELYGKYTGRFKNRTCDTAGTNCSRFVKIIKKAERPTLFCLYLFKGGYKCKIVVCRSETLLFQMICLLF